MAGTPGAGLAGAISVKPANKASWDDLQAIFGTRGDPARCQCQYFRLTPAEWSASHLGERAARFREQTACGRPRARGTSGLVAYLDGEPAAGARSNPVRSTCTCSAAGWCGPAGTRTGRT